MPGCDSAAPGGSEPGGPTAGRSAAGRLEPGGPALGGPASGAGFRRRLPARVALSGLALVGFVAATTVSLLWWRNDADVCLCEYCPDGYCEYAERIAAVLRERTPDALEALAQFGRIFTHAHSPLAPLLEALTASSLGLSRMIHAFILVNLAAGLLAWHALRRSVERVCSPTPAVVATLFVGFFGHALVLRALSRPTTDMLGTACVIWSLYALARHADERTLRSGLWLFAWQLVSLFSRVSCIPLLGVPALRELAGSGRLVPRLGRALRAGLAFGALPGAAFLTVTRLLGIENLDAAWRFAHEPKFVAGYTLASFLEGIAVAGQGWLVGGIATLALRHRASPSPILAIHLSWLAVYLAFLALGRGALWPRYFLPVVPSVLVLAAPALAYVQRTRRLLVPAAALFALALNVFVVRHLSILHGFGPPSRLLWADLRAALSGNEPLPAVTLGRQPQLRVAANVASAAAPLAADRDLDTGWKTSGWQQPGVELTVGLERQADVAGLSLLSTSRTFPSSLVVATSLDGRLWTPVAWVEGRAALRGFFEEKPRVVIRLPALPARALSLRLVEPAPAPWSVNEVAVHLAPEGQARAGTTHQGPAPP